MKRRGNGEGSILQRKDGRWMARFLDEAGKLAPDEGESVRAIKVRLSKAAKDLGKTLEVWDFDGSVFFKLSSAKVSVGRGRPRKS